MEVISPQAVNRDVYSKMKVDKQHSSHGCPRTDIVACLLKSRGMPLQEGEAEKEKTYCAVIWASRAISPSDAAKLNTIEVRERSCARRDFRLGIMDLASARTEAFGVTVWRVSWRMQDLCIHQGTPVRVLHRRAAMTRERFIRNLHCQVVPRCPQYATLILKVMENLDCLNCI